MIKNKISIERQINDRQYQFVVPYDASLSETLAVLDDMRKFVMEKIDEAEKQYAQHKEQEQEKQKVEV